MPTVEDILEFLASQGLADDWQPAETIESGGGTIPKTSSKGLIRSATNEIIEVGAFARIMAQYALRDRAAMRAAAVLGSLALDQAALAHKALADLRQRVWQAGRVYIPRKYVVSGLEVSAGNGRSLSIAAGVAVQGGMRRRYEARPNAIAVPGNPGTSAKTYVLSLTNDGAVQLTEGSGAPEGGLGLARITVPAGDVGATFAGTITDIRTVATPSTFFPPVLPNVTVALPYPMPDTDYHVLLHVESASDMGRVALEVVGKTKNAFTLSNRGTADDIVVRWVAYHPAWR
ncbi:hypothetical protein [Thermus scotoductus]|uniref:Uncharacterized protein n=1 Tax=Thermus scotoductus TaxID=37636 RepID=A0A430RWB0_THESC|nr:hypothetical protein [Thermus scotoductus]RTG92917.1 hypothetical protein CSW51_10035 [Thermus scotoductus]RTH24589.1 hypothetical protein CSW38_08740 [Thermus scotoductus]